VKKTIIYLFLMFNIFVIVSLFISYLSVYIPPDKLWFPAFFGLAFPFIIAVNLLFIIFWVFIKPRFVFISLFAVLVGWGFINRYVQFSGKSTDESGIKIVSYNVQHFAGKMEEDQRTLRRVLPHGQSQLAANREGRLESLHGNGNASLRTDQELNGLPSVGAPAVRVPARLPPPRFPR